ncbi:STAS domain-containing protein [Streptomyces beijiangensis]|uniref:STAS domain-containing protein n=1 Tax=Streptomyces beijiangensis TaxID=163361 RepID=UPI0027DCEB4C|nr:STAS domain-containing protein [Streptomyces beijiangensis]
MGVPHGADHSPGEPKRTTALLAVHALQDRPGVRAVGEISLTTLIAWEQLLEKIASEPSHAFFLDLAAVSFIDVAGASALAVTAQNLGAGRRIVVGRPPFELERLMGLFWPDLPTIEMVAQ